MATVPFGWSEERFDEGNVRTLVALIEQHEKAERNKAKAVGYMTACYMGGKDPDEAAVDPKAIRKKELEMGNAMW